MERLEGMLVVGGAYREECISPHWSRIFGSGVRAATALSLLSPQSELHTYAAHGWASDLRNSLEATGIICHITEIETDISFRYLYPLSIPELSPPEIPRQPPLRVTGDTILRFGFVEGEGVVVGGRVVFDPQNSNDVQRFAENGSKAGVLAIVLNENEVQLSTGQNGWAAARTLLNSTGAEVLVVKSGPRGAAVYDRETCLYVPAFESRSVFKIGSGDIFTAVFAHYWAERAWRAYDAAQEASRAVARYVESRDAQVGQSSHVVGPEVAFRSDPPKIYLAAPFFNLAQRWLVEEIRRTLMAAGADVFSPLHDVGIGGDPRKIAQRDIEGIVASDSMLAILDCADIGTIFEIGYARSKGIPVVVCIANGDRHALTMVEGSGCKIVSDISTAVYKVVWAAMG